MNKETKNINVVYKDNGKWVVRNNGNIIAEGQGINEMHETVNEIKKTATKPVKYTYHF